MSSHTDENNMQTLSSLDTMDHRQPCTAPTLLLISKACPTFIVLSPVGLGCDNESISKSVAAIALCDAVSIHFHGNF